MKKYLLVLAIILSTLSFAQNTNATLTCSGASLAGDDGNGSLTLMSSPQSAFGCCFIFNSNAGAPSGSYITASCDSNVLTLTHAITITSVTLEARKNVGAFNPFITLVVTSPNLQTRRFPMFWLATSDQTRSYQWNLNMNLPIGTTMYLDSYFSANSASICAIANTCIASTVWTLQGPVN